MALSIMMYGSYACEATAVTRDRLLTLRVAFKESMKENDAEVVAILTKYNHGGVRTPVLVFGDDEIVLVEPTVEQLEEALTKAGYTFTPRQSQTLRSLRGAPDLSSLPAFCTEAIGDISLRASQTVVIFGHTPACRVCQGYAKQVVTQLPKFKELGARLQFVLQADLKSAEAWAKEYAPGAVVIADADAEKKREYANFLPDSLDVRPGGTWLLIIDREDTLRVGQYSSDAGGLISPTEIIQQLMKG